MLDTFLDFGETEMYDEVDLIRLFYQERIEMNICIISHIAVLSQSNQVLL